MEPEPSRSAGPAVYLGGLRCDARYSEGYGALQRADWAGARDFFTAALAQERTPEALECLAVAATFLGDEDAVFASREAAYEIYRARNDLLGAGRTAVQLTVDNATLRGAIALANGWLQRAHTVLSSVPQAAEHGWLASVEAQKAIIVFNDCAEAELRAAEAAAIARDVGDLDLEAEALAVEGIAMVTSGRVREGLARLDEAGAACLSGDVRAPWVVSSVMCNIMDACDRARDWDRAKEWFTHVEVLADRWNDRALYGQCRPHYAVVLTWRGAWEEAERELQLSIEDLGGPLKPMAVEGLVRLAELRWRQGRWDEATALFEQVKHEPLAQLGRATLALEQHDFQTALELVDRCLRRLPLADRLERLPGLELYVRACLATGDCDGARHKLPELEEIMSTLATRPAQASACTAMGLLAVAEGRFEDARAHLEDAVDLFDRSGAPFEAGRARIELADALSKLVRPGDALREAELALAQLEALGASREASRARALVAEVHRAASAAAGPAPAGLTPRELEVLRMLAGGKSNQEIADALVLSVRTVQRHVENIYAKIGAHGRAAAAVFAATHSIVPASPESAG